MVAIKIITLDDQDAYQEYFLHSENFQDYRENQKINLFIFASLSALYIVFTIIQKYIRKIQIISFYLVMIIAPFTFGYKSCFKKEVIIFDSLLVYLLLYYSMQQVLDDCIYQYFIAVINITLASVMLGSYKVYDVDGKEINFRGFKFYQAYVAVTSMLVIIGFILTSLDVVQSRKKSFLFNVKVTTLKTSYENVINSFPQGILVTTLDTEILYMNDELRGFLKDEEVSNTEEVLQHKLFTPYQLGQSKDTTLRNAINISDIVQDFHYYNNSKQYYQINVNHIPEGVENIFNIEPDIIEVELFSIIFDDQQAILMLIKNISQLLKAEKQKNESKYQELLTATLSHEMMNPLNSIITLSGLVEQQYYGPVIPQKMAQDWIEYFKIINSSSKIMYYLVKSQIDIQQIKQGKFSVNNTSQRPMDMIKTVTNLFKMQLNQKNVPLIILETQDTPRYLVSDWEKYQQILINFIQNSVKFTVEGEIRVLVGFQTMDATQNTLMYSNSQDCETCGYLQTQIFDTGIGIKEDMKQRLFQVYKAQDTEEASIIGSSGVGLGLSISKDLILAMKGSVKIESQEGTGTEVTFRIKVQQESCLRNHEQDKGKDFCRQMPYEQKISVKLQNEYKIQIIEDSNLKPREVSSFRTSRDFSSSNDPLPNIPISNNYKKQSSNVKYLLNNNSSLISKVNGLRNQGSNRRLFGNDIDIQSINFSQINSIVLQKHKTQKNETLKTLQNQHESTVKSNSGGKSNNNVGTNGQVSSNSSYINLNLNFNNNSTLLSKKKRSKKGRKQVKDKRVYDKKYKQRLSLLDPQPFDSVRYSILRMNNNIFQGDHASNINQSSIDYATHTEKSKDIFKGSNSNFKTQNMISSLTSIEHLAGLADRSPLQRKKIEYKYNSGLPVATMTREGSAMSGQSHQLLNPLHIRAVSSKNLFSNKKQPAPLVKLQLGQLNNATQGNMGDTDSFNKDYDIVYSTSTHKNDLPNLTVFHRNYGIKSGTMVIEEELQNSKLSEIYGPRQVRDSTSMMNILNPQANALQIMNNNEADPCTLRNQVSGSFNQNLEIFDDEDNNTFQTRVQVIAGKQKECSCSAEILIVDDQMFNLIALELILKEMFGLAVDKAFNGLEAVNLFNKKILKKCCDMKYKLILMDLNMPIMDGYESTQQILAQFKRLYPDGSYPNGDKMQIIAVTAFVNDENVKMCYQVGMKDVLHKPVDFGALGKALDIHFHYKTNN
ncbi:pas pac sensor hybrid histidine kinase [Stylonychia lemnae]|uniref:Pas pac sensor hybrid histidine kinase n=1 Tax=Stylonychia lemnae TaxID=5949 RepID=A0A078AZG6_STYLE|nr:pas pac sensor hybrid histidine kinase [Stylonychia lemnae]|eukprot:CDW87830.1 pas pac sensor hybrid histidine kinase [Stylonychia lemnae]